MGDLLFCKQPVAEFPYFIEGISLNIYSLEELCYFIMNNAYLLDRNIMSEELCTWIEMQMKEPEVADNLRNVISSNGSLDAFVLLILNACSFCTKEEKQQIVLEISLMEQKSDFECNKIRADKLMENEKYLRAIYEYKRLLNSEDANTENDILIGNIYHNLGTAYARLFLFMDAIDAYEKAYSMNQKKTSLKALLMAYRCVHDEEGFENTARKNLLTDIEIAEIKNEVSVASRNERTVNFEEQLEAIAMIADRDKRKYKAEIEKIILDWKEQYRRLNRV